MAKISIRYFTRRPRADGTMRYFWQPTVALMAHGFKLERLSDIESEAMKQAQAFNAQVDEWRAGRAAVLSKTEPVTLTKLIADYKASRSYKKLAEKTRKSSYGYAFRQIQAWAGDAPVVSITPRAVRAYYEALGFHYQGEGRERVRVDTPAKAAAIMRVLRLLFSYAVAENVIGKNPASNMDIAVAAKKGRLWTPDEVAYFVQTADALGYFSIGSAVMLNEWMGQRKGDIIALRAQAWRKGAIHIRQSKTQAEVELPVGLIPALAARLNEQRRRWPDSPTLFPNEDGRRMTETMFRDRFQLIRAKAAETRPEMKDVIFMTLRHTAITRLAESGCDVPQIAAISGHRFKTCEQILERYVVRTAKMAREAFSRRQAHETAQLFPVETPATEQDQQNSGGNTAAGSNPKGK